MPRSLTERMQQFFSGVITSIVPGYGATNLGKREDDAHNSGDVGVEVLGVRSDTATAIAAAGDYHPFLIDAYGRLWASDSWRIAVNADVTANDSDKSVTVPAATEWAILSIFVKLTASATVGDRQLQINFTTGAAAIMGQVRARLTQAAGLAYYYQFGVGVPKDTAVYDTDHVAVPLPANIYLPAGYIVRVFDNNAVDAAADDMDVYITYAYRAV